jgi:hypothetical protein
VQRTNAAKIAEREIALESEIAKSVNDVEAEASLREQILAMYPVAGL